MPVAAGVVRDLRMAARRVLAARDISAERRRATALDRTHHLQLIEAHMSAVGLTPSRTVVAENVRDLQNWSSHGRRRYAAGGSALSRFALRRRGARRPSSAVTDRGVPPAASRAGPCGALRLLDADDHLLAVDVTRPQPHHLAGDCEGLSRPRGSPKDPSTWLPRHG